MVRKHRVGVINQNVKSAALEKPEDLYPSSDCANKTAGTMTGYYAKVLVGFPFQDKEQNHRIRFYEPLGTRTTAKMPKEDWRWQLIDTGCDVGSLISQKEFERLKNDPRHRSTNCFRVGEEYEKPMILGTANGNSMEVTGHCFLKTHWRDRPTVEKRMRKTATMWISYLICPDLDDDYIVGEPDCRRLGIINDKFIPVRINGEEIEVERSKPTPTKSFREMKHRGKLKKVKSQAVVVKLKPWDQTMVKVKVDVEAMFKEKDQVLISPATTADGITFRAGVIDRRTVEAMNGKIQLTLFNDSDKTKEEAFGEEDIVVEAIEQNLIGKVSRVQFGAEKNNEEDTVIVTYPGEDEMTIKTKILEARMSLDKDLILSGHVKGAKYKNINDRAYEKTEEGYKKLVEAIAAEREKHCAEIDPYSEGWGDAVVKHHEEAMNVKGALKELTLIMIRHYAAAFYGEGCPFPKLRGISFEAKLKPGVTGHIAQGFKQGKYRETSLRFLLDAEIKDGKQALWDVERLGYPIITSPAFIAARKGKPYGRLVNDYRKFNELTMDQGWAAPNQTSHFERMETREFFCAQDLALGFNEVEVHPNTRPLLAISTPFADRPVMETKVCSLGPKQIPEFFQEKTESRFGEAVDREGKNFMVPFIDDVSWGGDDNTKLQETSLEEMRKAIVGVVKKLRTIKEDEEFLTEEEKKLAKSDWIPGDLSEEAV